MLESQAIPGLKKKLTLAPMGRDLGSLPPSGRPFRFGSLHLRLRIQAVEERQGDRKRAVHFELSAGHGPRIWRRSEDPLPSRGLERLLVEREGALDGRDRARRQRRPKDRLVLVDLLRVRIL